MSTPNTQTVDKPYYLYSWDEFETLREASIALAATSLFFSGLTVLVYMSMLYYRSPSANRVSLRCVLISSVANAISDVFVIANSAIAANNRFCPASSILLIFFDTVSISLLTVVGVNLALIFVVNIRRRDLVELYYYPCVTLYGVLTVIGPIRDTPLINFNELGADYTCWYFIRYYKDNGSTDLYWMWVYAFTFLLVVISLVCSVTALTKLVREQRIIRRDLASAAELSHTRQSVVFRKVVLRCIVYTLIPLIVNIWGFAKQVVIVNPYVNPEAWLIVIDIILFNLEGIFVCMVFFTDPATTAFYGEWIKQIRKKYVDEYDEVIVDDEKGFRTPIGVPCVELPPPMQPDQGPMDDTQIQIPPYPSLPPPSRRPLSSTHDLPGTTSRPSSITILPVRRIEVARSVYNTISSERSRNRYSQASAYSRDQPSVYIDLSPSRNILIPYRHPRIARALHRLLGAISGSRGDYHGEQAL